MIISCINCNKKFDLNSDLIPESGRLLECSSCSHQWFFKKEILVNISKKDATKNTDSSDKILAQNKDELIIEDDSENIELFNKKNFTEIDNEVSKKEVFESKKKDPVTKKNKKKKYNFLKIIIVFIISFVALIILTDTFTYQIGKIIPNIEFILFNLYESIKDIILFFKDLI
jgi:DNA-directed RNA polymerase subunit RPC12/RpoP